MRATDAVGANTGSRDSVRADGGDGNVYAEQDVLLSPIDLAGKLRPGFQGSPLQGCGWWPATSVPWPIPSAMVKMVTVCRLVMPQPWLLCWSSWLPTILNRNRCSRLPVIKSHCIGSSTSFTAAC